MSQETNPYQAPRGHIPLPSDTRPIIPASKGRRFGTLLVDYALNMAFGACVGVFIALTYGQAGLDALQQIPDLLLGIILMLVYYVFFEGIWGRTPGKFIFGTLVVNESGGKASFGQVFGRTLCRLIPFEAFSFLGGEGRGWHDSIPKTHVVLARGMRD